MNSHRSRTEPKDSVLPPKRGGKLFKTYSVLSNREVEPERLVAFSRRADVSDCQI